MPDVALITSTYRSEAYLEAYTRNVITLAKKCHEAGVALELVVVANEPSAAEQQALQRLRDMAPDGLGVTLAAVPRETVYASWNRGASLASAPMISFWGIDDTRYAPAIVEGAALLRAGCDVAYFPYEVRTAVDWGWFRTTDSTLYPARPFDAALFASKMSLGPFWMTSRAFYQRVGPFNEHFRVCGDFEWAQRALRVEGRFCPAQQVGGRFVVHGGNLSANTNPQKIVEENVIFLWYGLPEKLRPADPQLMRQTWDGWAGGAHPLPPATADWLWGEGARERQEAWLLQWRARQRRDNLLRLPRRVVDAAGLRPALARLGLMRSSPQ